MSPQFVRSCESLWAVGPGADVGLFSGVGAHVGFEVIGSREFPFADFTLEGPDAGVLAAVSSQLIGSREPLSATVVIANVRLLAGVLSDVHLEVRQLEVSLGAARVETDEWLSLLFGLCVHLRLTGDHVTGLVPYLRDDESGVSGHGHLDRGCSLVHVSVGWDASRGVSYDLQWESDMLLLLASWVLLLHVVGKGEDWVGMSTGHDHVLGHHWHRVVLKGLSGRSANSADV